MLPEGGTSSQIRPLNVLKRERELESLLVNVIQKTTSTDHSSAVVRGETGALTVHVLETLRRVRGPAETPGSQRSQKTCGT